MRCHEFRFDYFQLFSKHNLVVFCPFSLISLKHRSLLNQESFFRISFLKNATRDDVACIYKFNQLDSEDENLRKVSIFQVSNYSKSEWFQALGFNARYQLV